MICGNFVIQNFQFRCRFVATSRTDSERPVKHQARENKPVTSECTMGIWSRTINQSERALRWSYVKAFLCSSERNSSEVACVQRPADVEGKQSALMASFSCNLRQCFPRDNHIGIRCIRSLLYTTHRHLLSIDRRLSERAHSFSCITAEKY